MILVVDDDPAVQNMARRQLSPYGYVLTAASTEQCTPVTLCAARPDAILANAALPYDVFDRLRATDVLCKIPIVAIADTPPDTALRARFCDLTIPLIHGPRRKHALLNALEKAMLANSETGAAGIRSDLREEHAS